MQNISPRKRAILAHSEGIARGSRGAPLSCLLVGAAAAVKAPAILALPLIWLAGVPWRKSWRDVFVLSGADFEGGEPVAVLGLSR